MGSKFLRFTLLALLITLTVCSYSFASSDDNPEEEITSVFEGLSDAWEQSDGSAWGNYFSEDADFTVWFGLHLKGRQEISEGHQWVFDAVYPNTRYEFTITDFKF